MTEQTPTPADRLRQAASLLRKRATAVVHDVRTNDYWRGLGDSTIAKYAVGVEGGLGGPAGTFAALMHPGLGEALAALLEQAATDYQPGVLGNGLVICPDCCEETPCSHIRPALAVADTLLAAVTQ